MCRNNSPNSGNVIVFCIFTGVLLGLASGTVAAIWYMLPLKSPVRAFDEQHASNYRKRQMKREDFANRRAALKKETQRSLFSRALLWAGIGAFMGVLLGIPVSKAYSSGKLPPIFDHIESLIGFFYK